MSGEVKDPTSLHWKCVTCRGLHILEDNSLNHSCVSPNMDCLEYTGWPGLRLDGLIVSGMANFKGLSRCVASLICAYVLRCFPLLDLQPGEFFRCLLSLTLPVSIGGRFLPPFNVRSLLNTPICVDLHGRQFDLLHACSRAAHHTEVQCPSGFFHLGYGGHVEAKGLCFIGNGWTRTLGIQSRRRTSVFVTRSDKTCFADGMIRDSFPVRSRGSRTHLTWRHKLCRQQS